MVYLTGGCLGGESSGLKNTNLACGWGWQSGTAIQEVGEGLPRLALGQNTFLVFQYHTRSNATQMWVKGLLQYGSHMDGRNQVKMLNLPHV